MVDDRPDLYEAWQIEQQRSMHVLDDSTPQATWAAEFDPRQSSPNSLPTQTTSPHRPSFMTSVGINGQLVPMGMYGMNPPPSLYQGNYLNNTIFEGKGKQREVDFEAAFAQAAASLSPAQTDASTEDDVADITNALDITSLHLPDSESEDGVEFRQSVSFNRMPWESLISCVAFGTNSRTPTYHHQKKICQSGNLNLIS